MTARADEFLPTRNTRSPAGPWLDGARIASVYFLILLIMPEGNVISFVPMNLQPVLVVALGLGLLWFGSQLVATVGTAKGRVAVRTALFLYLSSQLVTFGIATRRYLVADEAKAADSSMVKIFALTGAAVFVCDCVRGWVQVERVVKAIAVGITIVATIGLIQFLFGFDPIKYMTLPGLRPLGVFDTVQIRDGLRRPAATANHPIEFGMICAMAVPLSLHLAFSTHDRGARARWWWLAVAIDLAGAMVSVSRTAILCLVVVVVIIVALTPGRRRFYIPIAGLAFVVAAGGAVPRLLGTLYNLVANAGDDPSVTGRTQDYPIAWAQVDRFPWFGRGYGTYFPTRYQLLDNQYLLTLIENGYVGMAAFALVMVAGVLAALRARSLTRDPHHRGLAAALCAAIAAAAAGAGTFDLLTYVMVNGLLFGLVGLAGAALRASRDDLAAAGAAPDRSGNTATSLPNP